MQGKSLRNLLGLSLIFIFILTIPASAKVSTPTNITVSREFTDADLTKKIEYDIHIGYDAIISIWYVINPSSDEQAVDNTIPKNEVWGEILINEDFSRKFYWIENVSVALSSLYSSPDFDNYFNDSSIYYTGVDPYLKIIFGMTVYVYYIGVPQNKITETFEITITDGMIDKATGTVGAWADFLVGAVGDTIDAIIDDPVANSIPITVTIVLIIISVVLIKKWKKKN